MSCNEIVKIFLHLSVFFCEKSVLKCSVFNRTKSYLGLERGRERGRKREREKESEARDSKREKKESLREREKVNNREGQMKTITIADGFIDNISLNIISFLNIKHCFSILEKKNDKKNSL